MYIFSIIFCEIIFEEFCTDENKKICWLLLTIILFIRTLIKTNATQGQGINFDNRMVKPNVKSGKSLVLERFLYDRFESSNAVIQRINNTECTNLQLEKELLLYYNKYVNISDCEMIRAKQVLEDIKSFVSTFLQKQYPNVLGDLIDCGSCKEGLKVIRPDEFDVMIPLHTNGHFNTELEPHHYLMNFLTGKMERMPICLHVNYGTNFKALFKLL
jgi:hypothetical protein